MASIMQGTTPSIALTVSTADFLLSDVTAINFYLKDACTLSTYTMGDLDIDTDTNTVTLNLTEQETAAFKKDSMLELQAQFYFRSGAVVGIKKIQLRVEDMLGVGD